MDVRDEIEEIERQEAIAKRKNLENDIIKNDNPWGYSSTGLEAKNAVMAMLSTKTGLYARIPITCKAENCPYKSSCMLLKYDMAPQGEKCAFETALIEQNLEGYKRDFDLSPEASFTDFTIVKELVNADIMMERAQALLAEEGIAIEEVYTGTNERSGEDFFRKEVSKALDIYERHSKMRDRLLENMMATRKAKSRLKDNNTHSVYDLIKESIDRDFVVEEVPDEFKDN